MIFGIGTDIIETARFEKLHDNAEHHRFLTRCFTEAEQAYLHGKPVQTMAGLFAAKEAVVKALGTGFRGFWPCEVEITHDALGKPCVMLHDAAEREAALRGIVCVHISISHNHTTAVAFAVAVLR